MLTHSVQCPVHTDAHAQCAQMLQRDLKMAKGDVSATAAWDKFCAKQSARARRTPLEIAHEHEKFGTDSKKPCALCEQVRARV